MSTAFHYEPLDPESRQIRLVRPVEPTWSTPTSTATQLEMRHFDLETCPPYFALSYTWGPPLPARAITVNGRGFHVRENLAGFLSCLRDDGAHHRIRQRAMEGSGWFWCDQLCIDQGAAREKSHQVAMMGDVYARARLVAAWVGGGRRLQEAAEFVVVRSGTGNGTGRPRLPRVPRPGCQDRDALDEWAFEVAALLGAPYWRRLWVVQEVLLAREVVFVCGVVEMTRACLASALDDIERPVIGMAEFRDVAKAIEAISGSARLDSEKFELLDALWRFGDNGCELPQDRVFALMSVVRPDQRIAIDYELSPADLWRRAMSVVQECGRPKEMYWLGAVGGDVTMWDCEKVLSGLGTRLQVDEVEKARALEAFGKKWELSRGES